MKAPNTNQQVVEQTLIFIPDISGFTRFVNETEIQHSQHIIEELLEVLIDSNNMGLEVSEIEGDAILFYRKGKAPTAAEALAQVQKMYVNFHAHLKKYETHRICQCGACASANDLALKFVVHFGDLATKQVKTFSKLFGRDVIVAHRLMKNNINKDEYVLFTNKLLRACSTWVNLDQVAWEAPKTGVENYDVGTVDYCHLSLDPLKEHIPPTQLKDYSIPGANEEFMCTEKVVEAPIEKVFDVISDMSYRHHWLNGLVGGDKFNHKVSQVGSTHRCVINGDDSDPFFVAHDFNINRDVITFTESNHQEQYSWVFCLRKIGRGLTKVEFHYYWKPNFMRKIMFNLFMKRKALKNIEQHLINLNAYCQSLQKEGRYHPNRILIAPARQAA